MMIRLSAILVALCLAGPAHAKDTASGNFMLPHCETSRNDDPSHCLGIIVGMGHLGPFLRADMRFCPPDNSTYKQALRVVLKFLHAHPELLHEEFKVLAHRALKEARPCSSPLETR